MLSLHHRLPPTPQQDEPHDALFSGRSNCATRQLLAILRANSVQLEAPVIRLNPYKHLMAKTNARSEKFHDSARSGGVRDNRSSFSRTESLGPTLFSSVQNLTWNFLPPLQSGRRRVGGG